MNLLRVLFSAFIFAFFSLNSIAQEVEWMSFEEAVDRSKDEPRKLLIDIYTDWCGWCKRMDKDAYSNEKLAKYINENFYPVKFNAEQRGDVEFAGHTFKFRPQGSKGVHELAAALTQNKLSYPTTVFIDEDMKVIQPLPGYMNAQTLHPIVKYIGDDHFKKTPWPEFQKNFKSSL